MKKLPISAALQALAEIIKRTPMSVAESIGAQTAFDLVEAELTKKTEQVAPDAVPADLSS